MKVKLTQDEATAFVQILHNASENSTFDTVYESKLSGIILREFTLKLMTRCMEMKPKVTLSVNTQQMYVLNKTLPQAQLKDGFQLSLFNEIYPQINQLCLNI